MTLDSLDKLYLLQDEKLDAKGLIQLVMKENFGNIPLKKRDNFHELYEAKFADPFEKMGLKNGITIYASTLAKTNALQTNLAFLGQFLDSVLDNQYPKVRYNLENNAHLKKL